MFNEWLALLRREFKNYSRVTLQKDVLAGITVAAVALPLALAFGVASGADAAAGLVTAILAGIIMGLLGGAPYQISGPTGAMSAVLIVIATRHGLTGVWMATLIAGGFILLLGLFRMGRVVQLIPAPVISGFTSGIAVIIALGQVEHFLGIKAPAAENIIEKMILMFEHDFHPNLYAVLVGLIVMAVMVGWGRLKISAQIPGSLLGIVVATGFAVVLGWDVPVIGSIPRSVLLENRLQLSSIPWNTAGELMIPAMSIAALGAIESLLCGAVAGNMTGIRMHTSIELVAQGVGNLVIPFFGGIPATAAIARTSVNIKSGGVTRLSPIIHGVAILVVVLVAAPLLEQVPLAALAGVLIVTAWRMNEWAAIRFFFGKRLVHAMAAFLITLVATVVFDLTQAILIGFGISSLIFMAQMSELQISHQPLDPTRLPIDPVHHAALAGHQVRVYYISGPLFFAAARKLNEIVEQTDPPSAKIVLSVRGVPLVDATGVEVLRELLHRQRHGGGDLLMASLQPRVEVLLERAGFIEQLGAENIFWSADRAILSLVGTLPPQEPEIPSGGSLDMAAALVITPEMLEDPAEEETNA